jgi:hypothetical protein
MHDLFTLIALTGMLYLVRNDPGSVALVSGLGLGARMGKSRHTWICRVGGGLVLLALVVVINPEARLLLMFIDSIGVELFVTLCVLHLRHHLMITAAVLLLPVLRAIYRYGPMPDFWPTRDVLRSAPRFAAYAVIYPIAFLVFVSLWTSLLILAGVSIFA